MITNDNIQAEASAHQLLRNTKVQAEIKKVQEKANIAADSHIKRRKNGQFAEENPKIEKP